MNILFFVLLFVIGFFALVVTGIILLVKLLTNNKTKTNSSVSTRPLTIPASETAEDIAKGSIRRIRFDSTKTGIKTALREQEMLESSEKAAGEWLSKNPDFEIISITATIGGMNASVTVWYKETANSCVEPTP